MSSAEEWDTVRAWWVITLKMHFFITKTDHQRVPNVMCVLNVKRMEDAWVVGYGSCFSMTRSPLLTPAQANDASQRLHEVAAWATSKGEWHRCRACDKKHARRIHTCTTKGPFSRLLLFTSAVVRVNVGKYSHKWSQAYWRRGKFTKMQCSEGRGRMLITKQEIPGRCLGS